VAEGQTELRLELPVDARIPEDYVDSERLRLEGYQKLSVASGPNSRDDQIDLVLEELADRYGEPPAPVHQLIAVSRLRRRAHHSSLSDVVVMGSNLRITPVDLPDSLQVRLQRMYPGAKYVPSARVVTVPLPTEEGVDLVAWTGNLLNAICPLPSPEVSNPTESD
jgi:transcription-repair coupling factor (superfamily II helicase)